MHRHFPRGRLAAALLAAALAAVPPLAPAQSSQPSAAGEAPYVSGGVGQMEARRLLRERDQYPLAIEVYQRQAGRELYTAGADVRITDARGTEVLSAQADGPFLFADVPPGRYTVEVSLDGVKRQKTERVGRDGTTRSIFVFGARS